MFAQCRVKKKSMLNAIKFFITLEIQYLEFQKIEIFGIMEY